MKSMHLFSLSILFFALPLVGAATDTHAVIKETFKLDFHKGPIAEISISIEGITHIGLIVISKIGTQYSYISYVGNNSSKDCKPKNLKITGLLTNLETVMERAKALAAPQNVLDIIRKFATSHNSFEKIQNAEEAQLHALMKKQWREGCKSQQSLRFQVESKRADEEFDKELNDILEYHRQTYGED